MLSFSSAYYAELSIAHFSAPFTIRGTAVTEDTIQRKLTAIFSADVVAYSRLMRDDELATITLLSEYRELMTDLILQHKGRVIDTPGDNMLAEFSSVVDAVQSAVAIQRELRVRNERFPDDRKMEFRIGINIGDVVQDNDRIYGDGVNIAARLEKIAQPGGICISRSAYDQIESKLPFGYDYLGEQTVKNIDKPLYAYRVLLDPENSRSEKQRKDSGKPEREKRDMNGASVHSSSSAADNSPVVATDRIKSLIHDPGDDPQLRKAINRLKHNVQDFVGDMAEDPARREEAIQGLLKSKQAKFTLGLGVFLLAVNVFTSFGSWWFQYPLLVVGLVSYLTWMKSSFKTSERIVSLRELILTEEMSRLSDRRKPTSREISRINERIRRCVNFYRNLYIYIGVNAFLILINLFTTPFSWWFQFPLVVWSFLLFIQWVRRKNQFPEQPKANGGQEST
jgi:class 3 adenylate cyclase